jgi:hypothetical protein
VRKIATFPTLCNKKFDSVNKMTFAYTEASNFSKRNKAHLDEAISIIRQTIITEKMGSIHIYSIKSLLNDLRMNFHNESGKNKKKWLRMRRKQGE